MGQFSVDVNTAAGPCTARHMFGGYGISTGGLTLALLTDLGQGQILWLKAGPDTRAVFEAAGCQRFTYRAQDKTRSLGYYTAPDDAMESADAMAPWARLALPGKPKSPGYAGKSKLAGMPEVGQQLLTAKAFVPARRKALLERAGKADGRLRALHCTRWHPPSAIKISNPHFWSNAMIEALVSGRLHGQPAQKLACTGKPFVTAKVRVHAGEPDVFVNVIAFSEAACAALLALGSGDAVALAGTLTPKAWIDKEGTPRPALDMVASQVLKTYHVARKRRALEPKAHGQEPSPRSQAG